TRVLGEVLDARLQRLGDKLQRDLDRARGNEAGVVRALADARKGFGLLLRVSELPALPAEVRAALGDAVRRALEQTQSSLEGSARADRSGRLSSILRRYPLTAQPDQETPPPSTPVPPGRRLLIGREGQPDVPRDPTPLSDGAHPVQLDPHRGAGPRAGQLTKHRHGTGDHPDLRAHAFTRPPR